MSDTRPTPEDPHAWLRQLGARAHQLRACTRAADHFTALDTPEDRNTGSWLMSSALVIADELAADIDGLARGLKERPADAALQLRVAALRVRAHQLHAATRAADHFLDHDTLDGRDTGGWLIATALGLAQKLAAELDDSALPTIRHPARAVADVLDASPPRHGMPAPLRGAA